MNVIDSKKTFELPDELCDANKINSYFINSLQNLNTVDDETVNFYNNNVKSRVNEFNFTLTSYETVKNILFSIKTNAAGVDGINIKMILLSCPYLVPFLTHIINCCIEKRYFPDSWKLAYIIPVPKVKIPSDYKDLRPISILPILSKLLEKVLNLQIQNHLKENNILPDIQSGFRPNHGCSTALLKVIDDILSARDTNKPTALVLLDYSKAFDTISHRLLLAILHYFGFSADAIVMIRNYLKNRQQCVKISGQVSDLLNICSGVPQGSILGPTLFTIFTANFHSSVTFCDLHCYADDHQLYLSFESDDFHNANQKINADLDSLLTSSKNHSLSINPRKSQVILFGNKTQRSFLLENLNICVDGEPLPFVDCARNLGLYVDHSLRFNNHVTNCIKKAYGNLKLLYGCRTYLNKKSKIILCDSFVLSQFNFADVVYFSCITKADQLRIQRVQNACIRFIYGIKRYESVSTKFKELNWLSMRERQIVHGCCLYFKVIRNKIPIYLYNKISFRGDLHNLNTRQRSLISPPRHRTAMYQRSFSYNIYKYYNLIPINLKVVESILTFKKHLRSLIVNKTLNFN